MSRLTRFAVIATVVIGGCAVVASAHPRLVHHHHSLWRVRVGAPVSVTRVVLVNGKPASYVDFNVKPKTTRIYVDGIYRGTCDEFDGFPQKMILEPGVHRIRLEGPDGQSVSETVKLQPRTEINLDLDL